jgi:diaminopimelate epimerase
MHFFKYHGTGNDFVVVERPRGPLPEPKQVRLLCDRHFGIGADGLLVAAAGTEVPWRMVYYNADGSRAEMCGNGIRCFVKFLVDHGHAGGPVVTVETDAGPKRCQVRTHDDGRVSAVRVHMGAPGLGGPDLSVELDGHRYPARALSMGNPHLVVFCGRVDERIVEREGERLSRLPAFPAGANVSFVRVDGPSDLSMRIYERGVGPTLACGTGACAAVVAACLTDRLPPGGAVRVSLPGGQVTVETDARLGAVWLEGPAVEVADGTVRLGLDKRA